MLEYITIVFIIIIALVCSQTITLLPSSKEERWTSKEGLEMNTYNTGNYKRPSEVALGTLGYTYFDKWGPSINFETKNKGNYGTIGDYPAIPLCDNCQLGVDCPNYTFTGQQNVCTVCSKNNLNTNYGNLDKPLYVNARSAGRPRQCRQIMNYMKK